MYGQIEETRTVSTSIRFNAIWAVILSINGVALYFRGLFMPLYSDDYEWVISNPGSKLLYYFTHANPFTRFYRPIQMSTSALFQTYFGWADTFPNHVFQLALHIGLCYLLFIWMRKLGWSRLQSALASWFMLIAQTNVLTVAGNDTGSEVTSTLFGCVALWLFYSALRTDSTVSRHPAGLYAGSLVCYALCLFSKESGVSFILAFALVYLVARQSDRRYSSTIPALGLAMLPYVAVTAFYLLLRSRVVTYPISFGQETYNFHIGANIFVNLCQFAISALVPVSTVQTFLAMKQQNVATLGVAAFGYLTLLGAVGYGLVLARRPRAVIMIVLLAIIATFPVILLNHVNEQYLYKAMPFISALVGIGLGELITRLRWSPVPFGITVMTLAMIGAGHTLATVEKVGLMRVNGDHANELVHAIVRFIPHVPYHGRLLLLNDPSGMIEYSEFYMSGFSVFEYGENIFNFLSHRDDFTAHVVQYRDAGGVTRSLDKDVVLLSHGSGFFEIPRDTHLPQFKQAKE